MKYLYSLYKTSLQVTIFFSYIETGVGMASSNGKPSWTPAPSGRRLGHHQTAARRTAPPREGI